MQVYSGACGDATSGEEGTPMPGQPVCGCLKTRDYKFQIVEIEKKNMSQDVQNLSNLSNAGALSSPALL